MLSINEIYNVDCRYAIDDIDNETIDILMTDIPYNISQNKQIDRSRIDNRSLNGIALSKNPISINTAGMLTLGFGSLSLRGWR